MQSSGYSIVLSDMHFYAHHGVLPQERAVGGDYLVTVKIYYNFSEAMLSDEVSYTINYAEVYKIVEEEMATPRNLLERVAYCIGVRILKTWNMATGVHLEVEKSNPPIGADGGKARVELNLIS